MTNEGPIQHSVIEQDSEGMAIVLEARHGIYAADVAEFFVSLHAEYGNEDRSCAWSVVAARVRERELERLAQA